ncbi:hypothetical protein JCGZ_19007 [Jatropha curcas]|uniref:GRAS43 protein n=1 Tax=Jatropha curcas TaxID=180498 RepID=A0A067JVL2_JATCU|nr:uncharacterized protein LOC105643678 [Jatropha curcas]AMR43779.1 GRAS43 protein [Jatropha curcas]KDP27927.1 hypothetical protein JCGZ_19007 [Jatropha curcas]
MKSFENFDFHEVQDKLSSTDINSENGEGHGGQLYATEDWGESAGIDSNGFEHGFCKDNSSKENLMFLPREQESFRDYGLFDYGILDCLRYDVLSPQIQTSLEEIAKLGVDQPRKSKQDQFSATSFDLLTSYVLKRMSRARIIKPTNDDTLSSEVISQGVSTEEIMRIAGERFIKSITKTSDIFSMLDNPFDLSFSGHPEEVAKKLELDELLLASAEKVSNQLYDRAKLLLNQCDFLASSTRNPVERVVRCTLCCNSSRRGKCKRGKENSCIDLGIRMGVQWTGLTQALVSESDCPLQLLKITAVGTSLKQLIEDTGKRLTNFAQSINLPFAFNIVMVSDMLDIKDNLFELDSDETLVVYCEYLPRRLIPLPDRLDSMMKVIRILNPIIMVVTEPEYNSTSPFFVNRFVEALFYFSAYFDCLESCMGDDPNRMIIESLHFGEGIRNIVATEGEKRKIQNAKLDVWRIFFDRFGMLETELSTSSLCKAKLIAKKFACGNACTLDMDGKSPLIGWKGTPLHSLSAWKFI